jgi:hypothetical protein
MEAAMPNPVRRPVRLPLVLAICASFASPLWSVSAFATTRPASGPAMEKYVSPHGDFVVYRPVGWTVTQDASGPGDWSIRVDGPHAHLQGALVARSTVSGGLFGALAATCRPLRQRCPDLALSNVRANRDRTRAVYDFTYTDRARGRREGRGWLALTRSGSTLRTCEAPAGRLSQYKDVLLTILANVRIMRGGFGAGAHAAPARPLPLTPHRLPDGSASFGLPAGWNCTDLRAGQFLARNPRDGATFMVGSVDFVTPRMGVRVNGVPVSPYLDPARAWPLVMRPFMSDLRYVSAEPLRDLDAQMGRAYTAGPVRTASLLYTYRSREGARCKGYTFGISYGSRLDTNWKFWHITVVAPEASFAAFAPTLAAMVDSYRISDAYARDYIARGTARLRELEQQTRATVARNADEIHAMMQAAYDERQRSQDWLDHERTDYIRGEQDWVSSVEGGAVWHTDAWGTKNTSTGQSWEGAPFDYYHYQGATTGGDLVPIDNREIYERVFK